MIMLAIILMLTWAAATLQGEVECNRTFPVWQVCTARGGGNAKTVVSPPSSSPSDGDNGGTGGTGSGGGAEHGHGRDGHGKGGSKK